MAAINKKEPFILGIGDLIILSLSLFAAIVLRYQGEPSATLLEMHEFPFAIIFIYSLVVFYISGLYGRTIHIARSSIPGTVIRSQIANGLIAVFLFYFIPGFIIAPKTILFIYIVLSTIFLILWRLHTYSLFSLVKKTPVMVIGSGPEVDELVHEMAINPRSALYCTHRFDPAELTPDMLKDEALSDVRYILIDVNDPRVEKILPALYENFFPEARILYIHRMYEETFDRIPLSCMNYAWIMSYVSSVTPAVFDAVKRLIDIIFGVVITFVTGTVYPFIALAIKIEDKGPVFIHQERIGRNGKKIVIYKYRSMQRNEWDKWVAEGDNKITKVGYFLRKTRIDELPQGLALLKGDLSLIGPRTDIIDLGKRLEQEIPYYSVRTVITPGLTGWAQVNQEKPPQSVEETKIRLSYDLYYIKHRSFSLDFSIFLRTMRTLLSRAGM